MPVAALIAAKDLRQRVRDRTAIIAALLLPFMMATILSLTVPNATGRSTSKYQFGVVNDDHGPAALFFVKEVLGPLQRQKLIQMHPASLARGRALVRTSKASATLVLPPGFSHGANGETPTDIEIVGNSQLFKQVGTYVARSIALSFANQLNSVRLAVASTRKPHASSSEVIRLGEHASEIPKQFKLHSVSLPSKELNLQTHEAAGMTIFFLFFTVQFGFLSLIEERSHGTLTRLRAASVSRRSIIFGKLLTSITIGLASTAVLAVATTLVLGAKWGGFPSVALLVFAAVIAATAMTACIATFVDTAEQAIEWQAIIAGLMGVYGGATFPVSQVGGTLASLSLLTPHAQFLRGLGLLSHGEGLGAVLPMLAMILAFAAILGGVALLRIRHLVDI
jgi:ABC-2 type transport system permease protein